VEPRYCPGSGVSKSRDAIDNRSEVGVINSLAELFTVLLPAVAGCGPLL
jgi:hypothetical protein